VTHPNLLEAVRGWATLLARLRQFFDERGLLEVQTPLARAYAVTDPHQRCFSLIDPANEGVVAGYLQPSPESAMKQLLAAGSGSIYQICKAFRAGESGVNHRAEFTLLEWYRVGYDHWQLMDEVAELVNELLGPLTLERITWREAFVRYVDLDPAVAKPEALNARLPDSMRIATLEASDEGQRRELLDRLLVSRVEPNLGRNCMTFLYDYPAGQAALARVRAESWPVASRFELYIDGLEIANGFHELKNAAEQRQRFEHDNRQRQREGNVEVALDEPLLSCLDRLPDCAGVAVGVDRLMKIRTGADSLVAGSPP
jgi:lysyl-tRNA synthetase class 2